MTFCAIDNPCRRKRTAMIPRREITLLSDAAARLLVPMHRHLCLDPGSAFTSRLHMPEFVAT